MERTKLVGARYERGWSQEGAAAKIGITRNTLSQWEQGKTNPYPMHISKLCEIYEKSARELDLVADRDVIQPDGYDMQILRRKLLQQAYEIAGMAMTLPAGNLFEAEVNMARPSNFVDQEQLTHFASMIQTSWQLLSADGLETVGALLPTFLPALDILAQQHSLMAAHLATQGYIINGLVAVLQLNYTLAEDHCKRAIIFSRIAEDKNLEVAALKHLATKYQDVGLPQKVLRTYQQALPLIDDVSPLLRSRTYLGLAIGSAQCGRQQEAWRYFGLAEETFPAKPEDDPGFMYADCGISTFNHYGGLMRLEFNQPEQAWQTFADVGKLKAVIPERTIIEIVNCQAEAAIAKRDMELAASHIQAGLAGALKLKSDKRWHDTYSVYQKMRLVWPAETQVKALASLFLSEQP